MPNSSNNYKTGELCDQRGEYVCLVCEMAGRETRVDVALGKIFPYCRACPPPHDGTWHLVRPS